jgi:hypothetical protein
VGCDGAVTEPLLESLFDPSSAGHDGAVILDGTSIASFGVHLPLSSRVSGGRRLGTRHAAALGLSERCDALVVVVSEERGTISTAHEGKLEELEGPGALRQRLTAFVAWRAKRSRPRSRVSAAAFARAAAAIILAIAGWAVVLGTERAPTTRTLSVPVAFRRVPPMWRIDGETPRYVEVTLSGPSGEFRDLDPTSLSAIVDAQTLSEGVQQTGLSPSDVEVPPGFTVEHIEPPGVRFVAKRLQEVEAEVNPLVEGRPRASLRLRSEPATVKLVVPAEGSAERVVVRTEPIDVSAMDGPRVVEAALWLPREARLAEGASDSVTVTIELRGEGDP